MKKKFLAALIALCLVFGVSGCDVGKPGAPSDKIAYTPYNGSTIEVNANNGNTGTYNSQLYFRNDLNLDMGDPMITYDKGYYYAYGTRGGTSLCCYRSTDLANWEKLPDCFTLAPQSWGIHTYLWAPDILKIGEKWYLYYTSGYVAPGAERQCQIGVAESNAPYGPFVQYTGTNALQQTIGLGDLPFQGMEDCTVLDATVFEDDDKQLYMYFSYDTTKGKDGHDTNSAEIWGVKMLDPVTWQIGTLTRLLSPGYQKISDKTRKIDWETWSPSFGNDFECLEGPYMVKQNGQYFLTYSANSFVDTEYAVGYAMSESPLGAYEKPNDFYLQNMLLGVPGQLGTYVNTRYLGFTTGTGHASVFKAGDEYMFAYHAHMNRDVWGKGDKGDWRALGVDYLYFDDAGMPYTNGPTYSLVRQPEVNSGFKNLAAQATFKSDGQNTSSLNDNYTNRAIRTDEVAKEASFTTGINSIEITFDKPVVVKAVNVFNSYDYTKKIDKIKQIDFGNGNGAVNIAFNKSYVKDDTKFIFPHAAFNIELKEELTTDKIIITFEGQNAFAIGEVEVLGRYAA